MKVGGIFILWIFKFLKKNLIITFHPVTLGANSSSGQFARVLRALKKLSDTKLIFTAPNADTEGRIIKTMIDEFANENPARIAVFTSMGRINYLSTLQFVDGIIGNSSSGISEAPSFRIGTINIGDRQTGRLKAESIIDCDPNTKLIERSIQQLYDPEFKNILKRVKSLYGDGTACKKIATVLRKERLPQDLKKVFYNQ